MGISVLGIDNVLLAVGDLAEARAFYEGVLGLQVKFADEEHRIVGYAIGSEEPGLVVRESGAERQAPRPTPKLWLEVPDVRLAAEALSAEGLRALVAPFEIPTGWVVEIADPWGNVIGLTDYVNMRSMARAAAAGV